MQNISKASVGSQSVSLIDFYDPKSTTSGIQEAIDALPDEGGQVSIPAGRYVLRNSIRVPSRVRLIGEGPATVLCVRPLKEIALAKDVRKGGRTLTLKNRAQVKVGEAIGVGDDNMRG